MGLVTGTGLRVFPEFVMCLKRGLGPTSIYLLVSGPKRGHLHYHLAEGPESPTDMCMNVFDP